MLHGLNHVPRLVFIISLAFVERIVNNDGAFRNSDIEEKSSHGLRVMFVTLWDMCLLNLKLVEK